MRVAAQVKKQHAQLGGATPVSGQLKPHYRTELPVRLKKSGESGPPLFEIEASDRYSPSSAAMRLLVVI